MLPLWQANKIVLFKCFCIGSWRSRNPKMEYILSKILIKQRNLLVKNHTYTHPTHLMRHADYAQTETNTHSHMHTSKVCV